jgi:hypothetical protein
MSLPLEAAEDAVALFVQPVVREHGIGLAHGVFTDLLECPREIVKARLALAAFGKVLVVAGDHIGFHQLLVT